MNEKLENFSNLRNNEFKEKTTLLNELEIFQIETSTITPDIIPDESERYILIPLGVLCGILILSALVYLMARNRKISLYCKSRKYHSDVALLRNEDLDDPTESLLKGKLEIENRYQSYQTNSQISKDSDGELYS